MKSTIVVTALMALTFAAIIAYPKLPAQNTVTGVEIEHTPHSLTTQQSPVVEVVFVLDTTGSMSGLIDTAKEKIWSIASTMASAQPTPEIRIGLVGYRDRGDAYVTKFVDLSDDLDSVYATLMQFEAGGGGDSPESVNQALYEAVNNMSWSDRAQAYQVVFLVGDAPPHMDYNEIRYPEIVASANARGIVVNTIQCGGLPTTVEPWTAIASLGQGTFFQVEQDGGAVAYATPFDEEIANLSAKLDATRLYYGSGEERERMQDKVAASEAISMTASTASLARRGVFNAGAGGRANMLGDKELVDAVTSGAVDLEGIDADALPEALRPMAPAAQKEFIAELADERADLQQQIRKLGEERQEFLAKKVEETDGAETSLDLKLYETVKTQASKAGLEYKDGPAF